MPAWLRRTLFLAALGALAALAFGPLVRAPFSVRDHGILLRAGGVDDSDVESPPSLFSLARRDLFAIDGDARPSSELDDAGEPDDVGEPGWALSGLSLAVSRRVCGLFDAEGTTPWGYRVENACLLALAAMGLHRFLRRLLMPWLGSEQTAGASRTAAALFFLHPLAPGLVFSLGARSDLLAILFLVWTAALFLRGRQDRVVWLTASAFVLAFLAGLSGELAVFLPLVLAAAEYLSAHRYRKRYDRLRTATTTLFTYGGAVALAAFLRMVETDALPTPGFVATWTALQAPGAAAELALLAVEKLGVLVLPASAHGAGIFGTALAGILFLFAMQPALVAARTAPRLWGWLFCAWLAALCFSLARGAQVRVQPGALGSSGVLFAAVAVMCVGLGVASTAVSGVARRVRPAVLLFGFAVLAHVNARPYALAGRYVAEVQRDLVEARLRNGRDAAILLVDARQPVRGIVPLDGDLEPLLHPAFTGETTRVEVGARVVSEPGLLALMREREFEELCADSLLVVFPVPPVSPVRGRSVERVGPPRQSVLLSAPPPSSGPRTWRRETRSPDLDLEALHVDALWVTAPSGSSLGDRAVVNWRARTPLELPMECTGAWWRASPAPEAVFDLSSSLAWRLSDRVRRVWFENGPPALGQAELRDEFPSLGPGVQPDTVDGDWYFGLALEEPLKGAVRAAGERGSWRVGLLDLQSLDYVALEGLVQPSGTLVFEDAALHVLAFVRATATGGPVAWHLDYRVDGLPVARAQGRRIGRSGSREE